MTETPPMTAEEIITATVDYYRTHPRGLGQGNACFYFLERTGAMCAVGRCLLDPEKAAECDGGVEDLVTYMAPSGERLDPLLVPQYRGHDIEFWSDLQHLHDTPRYWVGNGKGGYDLTAIGREERDRLIKAYT